MVDGDGLVQLRELDRILGLDEGKSTELRRRKVFGAVKLRTGVYVVRAEDIPLIADRIHRYIHRLPFHPVDNMTVREAAAALRLTEAAVYALLNRGDLERAQDEKWRCATRVSVRRWASRRGLPEAI